MSRTGMIECTMRGTYTTVQGEDLSLGLLTATEFTWGDRGRWTLSRSCRDAAERVARDLWRKLEREKVPLTQPAEN
ncbi:MAG: hypothetical protein ACLFU2_00980 [Opitutales bacterium]